MLQGPQAKNSVVTEATPYRVVVVPPGHGPKAELGCLAFGVLPGFAIGTYLVVQAPSSGLFGPILLVMAFFFGFFLIFGQKPVKYTLEKGVVSIAKKSLVGGREQKLEIPEGGYLALSPYTENRFALEIPGHPLFQPIAALNEADLKDFWPLVGKAVCRPVRIAGFQPRVPLKFANARKKEKAIYSRPRLSVSYFDPDTQQVFCEGNVTASYANLQPISVRCCMDGYDTGGEDNTYLYEFEVVIPSLEHDLFVAIYRCEEQRKTNLTEAETDARYAADFYRRYAGIS